MDADVRGLLLIVLAGIVGSSTLMPFKYVRGWKWENTWFIYSTLAYFLLPWASAILTVPHISSVFRRSDPLAVLLVALFGLGWGVSVVLYGLALEIVGLSLTSGIIFGCSIAIGSLVPLIAVQPHRVLTQSGVEIVGADLIMIIGVLLCAKAGSLRGRIRASDSQPSVRSARFTRGLLICFIAGLLTPLLNISLIVGADIVRKAVEMGAQPLYAPNSVWGLTVSMGALPSIGLCLTKLRRLKTWNFYSAPGTGRNYFLCLIMGLFFILSTVMYGSAASILGSLGPAVGWPIYMSSLIIGNNFWGWYTCEWRGAQLSAVLSMSLGIGVQVIAMVMLGMAK
jgi:L-rhamnose-H+ transport protein